ncbi:MAG TPA: MFS transporter [Candidatus Nanoarchaeia archaeon]|nr:MFS transporter [Candidatus Nanoarchaeia archaeon]
MVKAKKESSKNIWLLGASSLFNDIGSEMIAPILPFFVISLGGNGAAVGALSGLREGLASLFKLLGGWYSDKIGKRMPFVFLGYIVSIIFRFLLVLANTWQFVLAFISFERLGKSRDAPRDAIIAESTKRYGRGFGIHQMMDTIGAIFGAIIVLFLFWKFNLGFKPIIFIAVVVSAISLVPLFFVKEISAKPQKRSLLKGIKHLKKELKYFIFVAAIFSIANFGLFFFLLLRAREITGSIITALSLGVLFNVVWAIFSIPSGNLSDKLGRKKVLMIGYILFLIVSLGFIYANTLPLLALLFSLYGLVYAITQGNQKAFVSDLSGETKGTAQGFYQFIIGITTIAGGIIAGVLWDISPQIMFGYLSTMSFISIMLLASIKNRKLTGE